MPSQSGAKAKKYQEYIDNSKKFPTYFAEPLPREKFEASCTHFFRYIRKYCDELSTLLTDEFNVHRHLKIKLSSVQSIPRRPKSFRQI